jgi:hypothetical protein
MLYARLIFSAQAETKVLASAVVTPKIWLQSGLVLLLEYEKGGQGISKDLEGASAQEIQTLRGRSSGSDSGSTPIIIERVVRRPRGNHSNQNTNESL